VYLRRDEKDLFFCGRGGESAYDILSGAERGRERERTHESK